MKRIKVLLIVNRYNSGGICNQIKLLIDNMDEKKFDILIIGGNIEKNETFDRELFENIKFETKLVPHMYRNISLKNDIQSIIYTIGIINKFQPDIIHSHAAKAGLLARISAIFANCNPKVIHTYHGNVFEGYFSKSKSYLFILIEKLLSIFTDQIITISDSLKNELVAKYKIAKKEKIKTVQIGIRSHKYIIDNKIKRDWFRNEFKIGQDEIVITIIGRLTAVKNLHFFLNVFYESRKRTNKKIKAFVVGDGELKSELLNYSRSLNLATCNLSDKEDINIHTDVIFTSWRNDIDTVIAGSDIISLTSINEGTPLTLIEALLSKKAIITTNVGGVKDFIYNNKNGIVCELKTNEYVDRLIEMLENKNLMLKLGENGFQEAYDTFNETIYSYNTQELYKSIINP